MLQARAYVLQLLFLIAMLLGATALFNELTDPYGIYNTFCRVGANANKPGQKGHDRLVKAYAIRAIKPDVLVLGTSRVQYGINPNDEVLKAYGKRPYNAALLGSNIMMALRYLQHAEAISHVRLVVLGLDPLMFNDDNKDATRDFSDERLAVDANFKPQPFGPWTDVPSTLLSMDTTRLSIRTWRKQASIASDLTAWGQRSQEALQRLFSNTDDVSQRFIDVDKVYAKDYRKAAWPASQQTSANMRALRALIDFAIAHDTRLELYFTPEHVHLHEVAKHTGASYAIDKLMRVVAQVVQDAQRASARPSAVTLWNFATLNAVTLEAVPQKGSQARMQWFWEPTHTRDNVGHLMLARMLAPDHVVATMDPHESTLCRTLAEKIDEASLDARIAARQAALERWEAGHSAEVARIVAACDRP